MVPARARFSLSPDQSKLLASKASSIRCACSSIGALLVAEGGADRPRCTARRPSLSLLARNRACSARTLTSRSSMMRRRQSFFMFRVTCSATIRRTRRFSLASPSRECSLDNHSSSLIPFDAFRSSLVGSVRKLRLISWPSWPASTRLSSSSGPRPLAARTTSQAMRSDSLRRRCLSETAASSTPCTTIPGTSVAARATTLTRSRASPRSRWPASSRWPSMSSKPLLASWSGLDPFLRTGDLNGTSFS